MDRMSIFKAANNDEGHIQAVIAEKDFPEFEKLGFVKSTEDLKPATKRGKAADNESDKG